MMQEAYEVKAKNTFGEVCINKSLFMRSGLLQRSIPTFVAEWILDRFCRDGNLDDETLNKIHQFIDIHLPRKDEKESVKNKLADGESLTLIDRFSVFVDLKWNQKFVEIPCIDEVGYVDQYLLEQYPRMLGAGLWGAGKLVYYPPSESNMVGEIQLKEFKPLQLAHLDLDYICAARDEFTLTEWRQLIVTSMGYNPAAYTPNQQILLLTRLLPIVQKRINTIELAPKGTGKSFIYHNLSRYTRVISGGKVTAAVLFYNNRTNTPGLLSQFDLVVFDEAQTISFDNPGEIVGILKDYLESGRYSRGKQQVTSDAGIVLLGNIPITASGKPVDPILFRNLPSFLQETAFIDRLHGILPGWQLPRVTVDTPAQGLGFKADFFGEYMHALRDRGGYVEFVNQHLEIQGTEDMRDVKAIQKLAAGYLKLFFPNLKPSDYEFKEYCVDPSIRLRQSIRDQLCKLDPEYKEYQIYGKIK